MHDGMHDGMHGSMHGDSAGCGMARMHDGMTACSCGPNHPHCGADSSADSTGGTPGGGGIDDHAGHHGM